MDAQKPLVDVEAERGTVTLVLPLEVGHDEFKPGVLIIEGGAEREMELIK